MDIDQLIEFSNLIEDSFAQFFVSGFNCSCCHNHCIMSIQTISLLCFNNSHR